MDWLTRGWDQAHYLSAAVGAAAALALALLGWSELAVLCAPLLSVGARWAFWQIPPPGRSTAPGTPADGPSRLAQLFVAVLIFTLIVALVTVPFR